MSRTAPRRLAVLLATILPVVATSAATLRLARVAYANPTPTTDNLAPGSVPFGVVVDASGDCYVTNSGNGTISKIPSDGTPVQAWASVGDIRSYGIAIDASGNFYVADYGTDGHVAKIAPDGTANTSWAALPPSSLAIGLVTDADGNVYAGLNTDNKIVKITPDGTVNDWATLPAHSWPVGLAIDGDGNVYSANSGSDTITKVAHDGTVTLAWATLPSAASPWWLAVDSTGNVYSANSGLDTVSKITPDGTVTNGWATLPGTSTPTRLAFGPTDDACVTSYGDDTVSVFPADPTTPQAPTDVTITPGNLLLHLSFKPPVNTGHSAILRYEVSTDGSTWSTLTTSGSSTLTGTLTGLTAGVAYTVRVRAVNVIGDGPAVSGIGTPTQAAPVRPPLEVPADQHRGEIPVPAHPARYAGPVKRTVAQGRSRSGIDAYAMSGLGSYQMSVGEAASLSVHGVFPFDSARLTARGKADVRKLAGSLRYARAVTCEGYADYGGSAAHEQRLSVARAKAVCAALRADGATLTAVRIVGYGGTRPAIVGGSPGQRGLNRRVVVVVTGGFG